MLDAPDSGAGRGYGQRHLLQLKAIRILQAQGLPLSRIQQLLFRRSDDELERFTDSSGKIGLGIANVFPHALPSQETWTTYPLNAQLILVAREEARLSAGQLEAIRKICNTRERKTSKAR